MNTACSASFGLGPRRPSLRKGQTNSSNCSTLRLVGIPHRCLLCAICQTKAAGFWPDQDPMQESSIGAASSLVRWATKPATGCRDRLHESAASRVGVPIAGSTSRIEYVSLLTIGRAIGAAAMTPTDWSDCRSLGIALPAVIVNGLGVSLQECRDIDARTVESNPACPACAKVRLGLGLLKLKKRRK